MELKPSQLGVWLLWRTPGRTHWLRCASGYDAQQHAVRNRLAIYHIIHGVEASSTFDLDRELIDHVVRGR